MPPAAGATVSALTGGDPQGFCAALPAAATAIDAYAEAVFSEPLDRRRRPSDLLYGPLLERVLEPLRAHPADGAGRGPRPAADPGRQRASAALGGIGLDGVDRSGLADVARESLATGDVADGASLEGVLRRSVTEQVDPAALATAAAAFWAGEGGVAATRVDLGTIPADVAAAAGYPCLAG